jgi:hypothetical protein
MPLVRPLLSIILPLANQTRQIARGKYFSRFSTPGAMLFANRRYILSKAAKQGLPFLHSIRT